jgi:hypothetical protein
MPTSRGQFALRLLPPGEYEIAAFVDPQPNEWLVPAFLERLIVLATAPVFNQTTSNRDIVVVR